MSGVACCRQTPRWTGRVKDKVPSSYIGARAAQHNRQVALNVNARLVTLCLIAASTLPALATDLAGAPAVTVQSGSREDNESEIKAGYERVQKIKSPERAIAAESLGMRLGTVAVGKLVVVGSITDQSVKEILAQAHGPGRWNYNRRIKVTGDDRYAMVTIGDRERDPCCFGTLLFAYRNANWVLLHDVWISHLGPT